MAAPVLYFHGFASSPESAKIVALRPLLAPDVELHTPDLNLPEFERLDFEAIVAHVLAEGRRVRPRAIVGSSLGAIVALEAVRRGLVAPLVLIAPAIGIGHRWLTKLPEGDPIRVFNHARGADAWIHRAFFEQLATLDCDAEPPPARVTVLMGRQDETVPFTLVEEAWARWEASGKLVAGSRFHEVAEGDHGLVAHAAVIAAEIRASVA
ncbi:MAG TPA: YqiA/YcfP family alpha/beta fold hydrolase [Thermoanaerobaculia bacterium]